MKETKYAGTYNVNDFETLLKPLIMPNLYDDEHIIILYPNGKYEKIVGDKKREERKCVK